MSVRSQMLVPTLALLAYMPALMAEDQGGTAPASGSGSTLITVVGQPEAFSTGTGGSATKLALPDQEYPQSTTTLDSQDLESRSDHSLHDALANVPGLTVAAGEGRTTGDQFYIRGFPATTDVYLDGLKDNGYYLRDLYDVDRVEVLRGPSALLFGPGATGGAVNLITNKPTDHWTGSLQADAGLYDFQRISAGIGGPLIQDTLGMRLDAFDETSRSFRDHQKFTEYGIAPTLAYHLKTGTTFTLQVAHQFYDGTLDYGIPFVNGRPAPVNPGTYYGFKDDDFQHNDDTPATLTIGQQLGDHMSLTNSTRFGYYYRYYRADIPTQVAYPAETEAARQFLNDNLQKDFDNTTEYRAKGDIHGHDVSFLAGVEYSHTYYQYRQKVSTGLPTISVLNPNFPDTDGAGRANDLSGPLAVYFHSDTSAVSGYAVGTLQLSQQWLALLGGREDNFTSSYHSGPTTASAAVTELDHTDTHFSPRAALVYQPVKPVSIYASYSTSFDPSAETYTLSAATDTLPPEKTRDLELGVKATIAAGLEIYADVFNMEMYNARTTNLSNPSFQSLAGKQRTNGLEAGGDGHLTPSWTISGGIALYAAKITSSNSTTANDFNQNVPLQGKRPISTPRSSGSLWTTYRLDCGIYAGIGAQATSKVYADPANTNVIPGYLVANAMIGYDMHRWGTLWHVQLNVDNLFDTSYYSGASQNNPFSVMPGSPTTGEVSVGASF
jgi:catecholate siderophore receptor